MEISVEESEAVMSRAERLYTRIDVERALDRLADDIIDELSGTDPIVLCVMHGALVTAGMLLPRLQFPLRQDYVHATRYRGQTSGGDLAWIRQPTRSLQGEHVLVVDDILDEGITLAAIVDYCRGQGAASVRSAVLVEKKRYRSAALKADFVGLLVEDKYVFGFGMDYKGYLRNAPGIYAVAEGD